MKQKLLSIIAIALLLCSSATLWAQKVSKDKVKDIALKHYVQSHPNSRISTLSVKNVISSHGHDSATYHIVNYENGGFTIVSGDESAEPILGFTDNGTFNLDSVPEGLEFLLEGYSRYVKSVRNNGTENADAQSKWDAIQNGTSNASNARVSETPIAPLTTTQWGQSYNNDRGCGTNGAYNKFAPVSGCEAKSCGKAYAGCVALGFSQVLAYWKYQNNPNYSFDWNNMPNTLHNNTPDAQVDAIAHLIRKCGDMVYMDYTCDGSGAYTDYVASSLRKMGYPQSSYESRSRYSDEQWIAKIKSHLREDVPVVYRARDDKDGHVMIFDGWSHDRYFHINLGWTGYGNGTYYLIDDPEGFTKYHAAIFNIKPDYLLYPQHSTFDNPVTLPLNASGQIDYTDTRSNQHLGNNYNGRNNQSSEDIFYSFELLKDSEVEISTCGSGLSDTYIHLVDANRNLVYENDEARESCAGTHYSYLNKNLKAGTYYLIAEGYRGAYGSITTQIKTLKTQDLVGTSIANPIVLPEPTTSKWEYTYADSKSNQGYGNEYTGAHNQPSEDIFYKLELKKSSEVEVSTCGSPLSDTYFHILNENGNMIYENDEARASCAGTHHSYLKTELGVGTYYVVSEGYTSSTGVINTQINTKEVVLKPGSNLSVAIPAFVFRPNEPRISVTKTKSNVGMGDKFTGYYNNSSEDIFYSFELQTEADVVISTCGSALYDTYIHLLKEDGSEYLRNDDGGCETYRQSTISTKLGVGKYYVVAEAYSNYSGEISLNMAAIRTTQLGNLDFAREKDMQSGTSEPRFSGEKESLSVSPNPAKNDLTILSESKLIGWEIISLSGRQVLKGTDKKIHLASLSSGLWLIKIQTEEGTTILKFTKK